MRNVREANLAWALIEAAKPHMNAGERNYVFVAVGAGDTFEAIRSLINLIAAKSIPLHTHLMLRIKAWLDTYSLHEEHEQLRRAIEDLVPSAIEASTAIGRVPAQPKPVPPLAITARYRTRRLPAVRSADRRALR